MWDQLNTWDTDALLAINGEHAAWLDRVMILSSTRVAWIPLYALLLFFMIRKMGWKHALISGSLVAVLILLTDQVSSGLIKPWVARLRPCHDPAVLSQLVMLPHHACPHQKYGFVSSHATNMFAVMCYIGWVLRPHYRHIILYLLPAAVLVSLSRVYLGFHYPSDVICGGLLGVLAAFVVSRLQKWILNRLQLKAQT